MAPASLDAYPPSAEKGKRLANVYQTLLLTLPAGYQLCLAKQIKALRRAARGEVVCSEFAW